MMSPSGTQQTWLITGASSGFGKSLALEALSSGHRVIGTTRDVSKAQAQVPEFAARGGIWIALDPGDKTSFDAFAKLSREYDVDVLVNNAGYALIGGVEDSSEDEVRDQLEVNFYGPLRAIKACLPVMRAKRSGHIVLMSSGAGFIARPGRSSYAASKFAIEAVHESLSHEIAPFGIKVLIVEPGYFRTPFANRIITPAAHERTGGFSESYKDTPVDTMVSGMRKIAATQPDSGKGDPDKAARAIVDAVRDGHDYLRMPLGPDCVVALEDKVARLKSDLDKTRAVAMATDFD